MEPEFKIYKKEGEGKIEWQEYEYEYNERHPDWYWFVGIAVGLLVLISLLIGNILLAIILALGIVVLVLQGRREPELIDIALVPKGLRIGHDFYPYESLKYFTISPENHKLSVHSSRIFSPIIIVPLGDADPSSVEAYLKDLLPKEEYQESLIENIFKNLGF